MTTLDEIKNELYERIIQNDLNKFIKETNSKNILHAILKGHLYIEQEVVRLLNFKLKNPEKILTNNFGFANKIKLAVALGIISVESMESYLVFNSIRNKYAHQLDYQLGEKDLNLVRKNFCSTLENDYVTDVLTSSTSILNPNLFLENEELSLIVRFKGIILILWKHLKTILLTILTEEIENYLDDDNKQHQFVLINELLDSGAIKIDLPDDFEEKLRGKLAVIFKNRESGVMDIIRKMI
ncbi:MULTISPECIES: hypothetical protein [Priestia]|uniref:hypothetical protein n=1 Tax=Priestia TaxID=2800373 RepID=UPI000C08A916|nr:MULTISPECIES: hypothetical protein [Priestia]TPF14149.1 hypothetical protein CBE78_26825 [Priestia megaterium]TPF19516.1 hypothetical protein CBE79_26685 [Priestia megaterium]UPK52910.1 hypothetical protein MT476_27335 [Bacillus sp. H8-1]UPK52967.1 hypothetical protein MT476_27625 [Bacillus sp. H8-1]